MKSKFPYADAMLVAEGLRDALAPFCERIEICGSLRRKKPEVGDIEILYISKPGTRKVDLLAVEDYGEAETRLDWMLGTGIIVRRANKNGIFAWGLKNKLGVHVPSGIPVDFFSSTRDCWWNSLVCRTGGKDSNLLITTAAQRRGWSFEAYGAGFHSLCGHEHFRSESERDVFEFVGLPYLPPEKRL